MWNMEDMDIDQVVEIPDTPDRVVARRGIGREIVQRDSGSLLHGNFRNKDTNGVRPTDKLVMDNRQHARRPLIYPARRHRNPETTNSSNLNAFNSSDNSSASQKDRLFRRPASDRSHSHRANRSSGVRNMDKGKSIYNGRSSGYQDGDNIFDLTKQNDNSEDRNTVSYGAPEHIVADDKRRGQIALHGTSFGPCIRDSSEMFRNDFKGKEKIDENTLRSSGLATVRGEAVNTSTDSQHKACERSSPRYITLRYPGKKSLVRNGCISPQNIAKAEQLKNTSENIRRSHAENGVSNRPQSPGNIMDIVAEENDRERGKGKAVLTVPSASENQSRGSYSSLATHNEEENGISDTSTDVFGSGGWRSTHNNLRNIEHSTNDTARPLSRRTGSSRSLFSRRHEYGVNRRDISSGQNPESECDHAVGRTAALRDTFVSETERSSRAPRPDTALNKRLKKIGSSSRNHGECSTPVSEDLDAVLLGSSRESMDTRSSRCHHSQSRAISDPVIDVDAFSPPVDSVIDVDAFSPPVRCFTPQTLDTSSNDDSEGRARQVEADEILARELQEQLYQEAPLGRSGNIDAEYMAWLMQQENDESNTSGARENESHPRNFVTSHPHRHPRSRTSLNRSNRTHNQSIRRGAQARVPGSSRMAQLRGRIDRQRPAVSTRARNLNFPLGMDLDMRLDILEALEDAFGDLSAADFNNHIFQVQQRDFNESDYEMLLALDDHNHQHAGASANQINNLPQSVVQTNNPEEPCAVCLEPPTIGETIRHLPCLHKFHKDCIDPWLGRKSSCPVCKSSIT